MWNLFLTLRTKWYQNTSIDYFNPYYYIYRWQSIFTLCVVSAESEPQGISSTLGNALRKVGGLLLDALRHFRRCQNPTFGTCMKTIIECLVMWEGKKICRYTDLFFCYSYGKRKKRKVIVLPDYHWSYSHECILSIIIITWVIHNGLVCCYFL